MITSNILISGAGQLGSRYLQGMAKCRVPLKIYVQDVYEESLVSARQRWNEVLGPETHHEVSFYSSFESLPQHLDVAVVATTADIRPQVVGKIASACDVKYWVLEKLLAQNESGLEELLSHVGGASGAWVNTPRRMMPWHRQIKSQLGLNSPMKLQLKGGGWGLACGAIHVLDLFAWWTGKTLQDISTERLDPHCFESKRKGFWEVLGTLEAHFSDGTCALIGAENGVDTDIIEARDDQFIWQINEAEGVARRSDGIEIKGRMAYQSEMTATLVDSILEQGRCDLPTLEESLILHRIFIRSMLEHWRRVENPAATVVPIT